MLDRMGRIRECATRRCKSARNCCPRFCCEEEGSLQGWGHCHSAGSALCGFLRAAATHSAFVLRSHGPHTSGSQQARVASVHTSHMFARAPSEHSVTYPRHAYSAPFQLTSAAPSSATHHWPHQRAAGVCSGAGPVLLFRRLTCKLSLRCLVTHLRDVAPCRVCAAHGERCFAQPQSPQPTTSHL